MKSSSPVAKLLKNKTADLKVLKEGDLVDVTLLQKSPKAVYFDMPAVGTGVVFGVELMNAQQITKGLSIGDNVTAKIVIPENDEGYIELSLSEAGKQKAWSELKDLMEKGEVLSVKIVGANSGGLLARINDLQAFLPVSQLTPDHYPRVSDGDKQKILDHLKGFVDQDMNVKIIDANPRTNKLIISEKEIVSENIKEELEKYKEGDIVDGIISGVADFGAFIKFADNPQIEGLIHISELDHRLIENPKEVVKVDEPVKAKITEIKDGRVSLSLKALKENPWESVDKKYKEGSETKGTVSRFNPFGAFIGLDGEIQGLIHVSEFGGVEEMKAALKEGEEYTFLIDSVKPEEKRIILKLKK